MSEDLTIADEMWYEELPPRDHATVARLIAAAVEQRGDTQWAAGYLDGHAIGAAEGFLRGVKVGRERPRGQGT